MYIPLAILVCVGLSNAFLMDAANWNDLKTTWGLNPLNKDYFVSQPRTAAAARHAGFKKISDCQEISHFAGNRYLKNGDPSLILLYDEQGFIAGIQAGFANNHSRGYPTANLINAPFVLYRGYYYITAYFVDPKIICKPGRTNTEFKQDGTGNKLLIQNGTNPSIHLDIPLDVSGMNGTMWTKGKCFYSMGLHYWYNLSLDMSCDKIFPIFLLYNQDRLNGFGWAFNTGLQSIHYEHPPKSILNRFLHPVPRCLANQGPLSTMHIYMTSMPMLDLC